MHSYIYTIIIKANLLRLISCPVPSLTLRDTNYWIASTAVPDIVVTIDPSSAIQVSLPTGFVLSAPSPLGSVSPAPASTFGTLEIVF